MGKETDKRVFVAFITYAGQILVIKRSKHTNNPGQLGLPGGHADEGETIEETARREVNEELGFDFDFAASSFMKIHADKKRTILVVPLGKDVAPMYPNAEEVEAVFMMNAVQVAALSDAEMHKSLRLAYAPLLSLTVRELWEALAPRSEVDTDFGSLS